VVIPKGRVVAPASNGGKYDDGRYVDFDTNQLTPVLTLANGGIDQSNEIAKDGTVYTRTANKPIGVAYANLYEQFIDGFNGMQPTVENEIYIEVPYIQKKSDAYDIEWGCFYDADLARPAKPGDFVMSDETGRIIKADFSKQEEILKDAQATADEKFAALAEISRYNQQVIGQIWAVETPIAEGMAPQGWLRWVTWAQEDFYKADSYINNSGFRPEDIGSQDGFPGYPYDKTYMNMEAGKYKQKGIPGLTNGSNIEVDYTDEVIGQIMPGQKDRYNFRILHLPAVAGSVKIHGRDGVSKAPIADNKITVHYVDETLGLVIVEMDNSQGTTPIEITATYKATGQIPGIPTGWDFKGSIGAVRILLQK
jgi:hypothetical protein